MALGLNEVNKKRSQRIEKAKEAIQANSIIERIKDDQEQIKISEKKLRPWQNAEYNLPKFHQAYAQKAVDKAQQVLAKNDYEKGFDDLLGKAAYTKKERDIVE